jgi:hypothetical protein
MVPGFDVRSTIAAILEESMQPEETKRPVEPEEQSPALEPIEDDESQTSPVSSYDWNDEEEDDPYEKLDYGFEANKPVHAATFAQADDEIVESDDDLVATQEMPAWAKPAATGSAAGVASSASRPQTSSTFEEEKPMARPSTFSTASGPTAVRPSITNLSDRPQVSDRLPLPHQPKLAEIDPMLYEYWREHINQGFQRNNRMFDTILDAFMRPYNTTIWMYRILFGLGIASFLVAAGLGAWLREPMFSLIFGGLSIVSFLTYFIGRPLQSLEENLKFITWLGIIYNTYWTRLVYMMDSETIHADLEDATQDAINELERLLDKHHDFSSKRPELKKE